MNTRRLTNVLGVVQRTRRSFFLVVFFTLSVRFVIHHWTSGWLIFTCIALGHVSTTLRMHSDRTLCTSGREWERKKSAYGNDLIFFSSSAQACSFLHVLVLNSQLGFLHFFFREIFSRFHTLQCRFCIIEAGPPTARQNKPFDSTLDFDSSYWRGRARGALRFGAECGEGTSVCGSRIELDVLRSIPRKEIPASKHGVDLDDVIKVDVVNSYDVGLFLAPCLRC